MQPRTHLRAVLLVAVGFAAGIGALGFRAVDNTQARPGLEAYRPDAVGAVDPARADDQGAHSNAEITVVMEVRNICRDFYLYARSDKPDPDALEARLRAAGTRTHAASTTAEGDGGANIDELVTYATSVVEQARKAGSVAPVKAFVSSECDPKQDYSQPILATDR
jgi:hypothetical protein